MWQRNASLAAAKESVYIVYLLDVFPIYTATRCLVVCSYVLRNWFMARHRPMKRKTESQSMRCDTQLLQKHVTTETATRAIQLYTSFISRAPEPCKHDAQVNVVANRLSFFSKWCTQTSQIWDSILNTPYFYA